MSINMYISSYAQWHRQIQCSVAICVQYTFSTITVTDDISEMSLLQKPFDVVLVPTLGTTMRVSHRPVHGRFVPQTSHINSLCTDLSTYLYDDMSRQSVDNNNFLLQAQRRYYFFSQLLDVPLNFPYSSLMEIAAAFGEVIYGQLL